MSSNLQEVSCLTTNSQRQERKPASLSMLLLRRFLKDRAGVAGLAAMLLMLTCAVAAPLVAPWHPYEMIRGSELQGPSLRHLFGTDRFGRDVLSRVIYGGRMSLAVGLTSVLSGCILGTAIGLLAGMYGGWVDMLLMRIIDTLMAFPPIFLGLAVAALLGRGLKNIAIAVAVITVPTFARIVRAAALAEKGKEYVLAARAIGAPNSWIVWKSVFPNCAPVILVQAALSVATAVLLEATYSFLGFGAQPPEPSWGIMLNTSRSFLRVAPWTGIFPGLTLSVLVLSLGFMADAMRGVLDPKNQPG